MQLCWGPQAAAAAEPGCQPFLAAHAAAAGDLDSCAIDVYQTCVHGLVGTGAAAAAAAAADAVAAYAAAAAGGQSCVTLVAVAQAALSVWTESAAEAHYCVEARAQQAAQPQDHQGACLAAQCTSLRQCLPVRCCRPCCQCSLSLECK